MSKIQITIIEFEDHFQDFLEFDVTPEGKIIDVRPFQRDIWSRWEVVNMKTQAKFGFVHIRHIETGDNLQIKYAIKKLTISEKEVTNG